MQLSALGSVSKIIKDIGKGATSFTAVSKACEGLSISQTKAVLSTTSLTNAERANILTTKGLEGAELKEAVAATTSTSVHTVLKGAVISLGNAFKGLWATIISNPILIIATAITAGITIFNKYQQKLEDIRSAHLEEGQAAKEEAKNITDLYNAYISASDAYKKGTGSKDALTSSTESLLSALGLEQSQIESLISEYGNLDTAMNKVTRDALTNDLKKLTSGYAAAREEAAKTVADDANIIYDIVGGNGISWDEDDPLVKYLDELDMLTEAQKEAGKMTWFVSDDLFSDEGYEQAKRMYDDLLSMREVLENNSGYTPAELAESSLYKAINDKIVSFQKVFGEVMDYEDQINGVLTQMSYMDYIDANGLPQTQAQFDALKESVLSAAESNSMYIGSQEQVKDSVVNTLSTIPELSKFFNDYTDSLGQSGDAVLDEMTRIEHMNKVMDDFANNRQAFYDSFTGTGLNKQERLDDEIATFNTWFDKLNDSDKEHVYTISCETETAEWKLEQWQEALKDARFTFDDLLAEQDTDTEDSFSTKIKDYLDKIEKLKSALDTLEKDGKIESKALAELIQQFPELAGHTGDLDSAIHKLMDNLKGGENTVGEFTGIYKVFQDAFGRLETDEDRAKLQSFMDTVLELGEVVGSTEFNIDIEAEAQGMEDFYTAVKESVSATGLSAKSIENLKERYKNLFTDDPDKRQELMNQLFERSEHGIHLNAAALRELESEYENTQKAMFKDELVVLTDKYNDLTEQINLCSDTSQKAQLYAKRQEVLDQINEVADLATQYEGLTSAFNKWLEAQDTPDEDDMFQKLSSGLEDIKTLFEEGRVGVDDFREAVQMMTDTDLSTASIEELLAMYDGGIGTMEKFFTGNSEGLQAFIDMLVSVSTQAGETWATIDEFGNYNFDFGVGDDSKIVEAINNMTDLQMSTEELQILLRALSAYGFDINLDSIFSKLDLLKTDFETLQDLVDNSNQKLKEIGATEFKFNINTDDVDDLNTQVGEIYQTILNMYAQNEKDELNLKYSEDDFKAAQDILAALIAQKESLNEACVLQINTTSADDDIHKVIGKLQEFQSAYSILDSLVAIGADTTQASQRVEELRQDILGEDTKIITTLQIDNTSVDAMYESINAIEPEMLVKAGIDEEEVQEFIKKDKDSESTIKYNVDSSDVDKFINQNHDTSAKVVYHNFANEVYSFINNLHDQHRYVYYHNVNADVNGTANYRGTAHAKGTAFKRGDWGTKDSGTALVGELGTETLVRDGMYQTIGENGAEFIRYRKGDIIFNHRQTEELFRNGIVTSGGGRGKVYANGTAFSGGSGTIHGTGTVTVNSSNGSSGGSGSNSSSEISYEKIDWIEIALNRISRTIDGLKRKAASIFNNLTTRNKNLSKEISNIGNEIEKNLAAADRYYKEAWNVGLSGDLAEKVRNGTIDITEYDSDTANKIQEYQKWYEKMLDCQNAAEELKETLKELYKEKFDNVVTNWTNKLKIYSHTIDRALSRIEQRTSEASKYVNPNNEISAYKNNIKDYKKIINDENKELKQLEKERNELTTLMWEAIYNGSIAVGSEAYYDMLQQIQDVENNIDSLNKEIIENTNQIAAQYENIFNSISDKYEMTLSYADKVSQNYNAQIELAEAKGLAASTYYYTQLRAKEQQNLKQLQQEQKELQQALNDAVASGAIKVGSEAWYEMKSAIQEVDNEIVNTTKDIVEYSNKIRQIKWDRFDTLQEKIKNVENETSFLISLLSDSKLHTDKGNFTNEGLATLGLYAIDYNLLMSQANDYADEIKKIQKEIANDPSNTDLIKRREELLKNQQDSIKAAENEKQAIVNLVEKGIKLELSSLKDLISAYTESLDNAKNLYDYQKKIRSQTSEITKLQKQLAAYANDTSEENRARVQKLTVDLSEAQEQLAETEYEQFISDSKKLLDNLYGEYEAILNERLDNVDALVQDMIDTVNDNSSEISQTIRDVSSEVGYTLTDEFNNILGNKGGTNSIVSYYGDKFDSALTTVNQALNSIESKLTALVTGQTTPTKPFIKFKSGGLANFTGLAQLDGTPDKPELVLNPKDTENYMKLTEALRQKASIPLTYSGSEYSGYVASVGHHIAGADTIREMMDKIGRYEGNEMNVVSNVTNNFEIDHVQDYNDFVNQLKSDDKFEKMINAMTVDRLMGGSSLAKNKFRWN